MAKESIKTDQSISIPGIEKRRFQITIEGVTSLISHRFSDEAKKEILAKQMKKPKGARKAKDPEADYLESIYWTEEGEPGFPAGGIKKACVSACRFISGLPMTHATGAFYITGEILPIKGEHRMREDNVRLPRNVADLRYRAEFPEWEITLTILHNPNVISQESIANLLETAGFHVGIGDWRPEKRGIHGMFQVKRSE